MYDWQLIFSSLLPRGALWRLSLTKYLKAFYLGLGKGIQDVLDFFKQVGKEGNPNTTSSLQLWAQQFGISNYGSLSDDQLRKQIVWKYQSRGGQSIAYIEDFFRIAGYDIKVYENYTLLDPTTLKRLDANVLTYSKFDPIVPKTQTWGNGGTYRSFAGSWILLVNNTGDTFTKYPLSSDINKRIYYVFLAGGKGLFDSVSMPKALEPVIIDLLLQIKPMHTRWMLNIYFN